MAARELKASERPFGIAFESWQLPLLELDDFRSLDGDSELVLGPEAVRYLLRFSLLAPSTHNTMPQAYRLDLDRAQIELWLRRQYVLPASDPQGKEALVSLGCALENLVLAAAQYGVACTWQPEPSLDWRLLAPSVTASDVCVGRVQLGPARLLPSAATRQRVLQGMLQRRTVRAEFDASERLPAELRAELEAAASADTTVRLALFESPADKFAWGKLDELAMKNKLEEQSFRHELGQWLLPNEDDQSPRGMRGREFGFEDRLTRELAAQLRDELPMAADQLTFMARAGRVGLCSSSAVCVLSCSDASPASAMTAGRVFQRCMLAATAHGFCCAMHTAVCHVPHALAMSKATLMKSLTPSVIFRIGKPRQAGDGARAHSARPRLEALLLDADAGLGPTPR